MNRMIIIPSVILLAFFCQSCDKETGTEIAVNTLMITEGEFAGYSHIYGHNLGYFANTDKSGQNIFLVLADSEQQIKDCANVMCIVFFETGATEVKFPGPEGQWVEFGIRHNGVDYKFRDKEAVLTIVEMDSDHFEGKLSGEFVDTADLSRTVNLEMGLVLTMRSI